MRCETHRLCDYVQSLEPAITCGGGRWTSPVIAGFAEDAGQFLRFGRAVLTSVSYTHLDVYKRQIEYLLNLANSGYEDWRRQNKDKHYFEYQLKINKMSVDVYKRQAMR